MRRSVRELMDPISRELREYVYAVRAYHLTDIYGKKREYVDTTTKELLEIADRIDAEFERRTSDEKQRMSEGARRIFDRLIELANEESEFERLKKKAEGKESG